MDNLNQIFGEVISSYSRAEAIEDGVLIDLDALQVRGVPVRYLEHFRLHIAITCAAWGQVMEGIEPQQLRESPELEIERMRHLLKQLHADITLGDRSTDFCLFSFFPFVNGEILKIDLKAICGPGDDRQPVITITLPLED